MIGFEMWKAYCIIVLWEGRSKFKWWLSNKRYNGSCGAFLLFYIPTIPVYLLLYAIHWNCGTDVAVLDQRCDS